MTNQQLRRESEPPRSSASEVPIQKNESELSTRLAEVIGTDSVSEFGRRCGIGEATIRNMIKSGASPRVEHVVAMADAANVNIEWLAAGRGPKMRGDSIISAPAAPTSGTTCFSEEDLERLIMAITTVEEALESIGSKLSADKRGHLIAAAYDILEDMDQKANVIKFIKLAA